MRGRTGRTVVGCGRGGSTVQVALQPSPVAILPSSHSSPSSSLPLPHDGEGSCTVIGRGRGEGGAGSGTGDFAAGTSWSQRGEALCSAARVSVGNAVGTIEFSIAMMTEGGTASSGGGTIDSDACSARRDSPHAAQRIEHSFSPGPITSLQIPRVHAVWERALLDMAMTGGGDSNGGLGKSAGVLAAGEGGCSATKAADDGGICGFAAGDAGGDCCSGMLGWSGGAWCVARNAMTAESEDEEDDEELEEDDCCSPSSTDDVAEVPEVEETVGSDDDETGDVEEVEEGRGEEEVAEESEEGAETDACEAEEAEADEDEEDRDDDDEEDELCDTEEAEARD